MKGLGIALIVVGVVAALLSLNNYLGIASWLDQREAQMQEGQRLLDQTTFSPLASQRVGLSNAMAQLSTIMVEKKGKQRQSLVIIVFGGLATIAGVVMLCKQDPENAEQQE